MRIESVLPQSHTRFRLRHQRARIEAENGNPDGASYASLEECSSRYIHYAALHDERLETVNRCRDGTEALGKRNVEGATKVCAVWSTSSPSRSLTTRDPNNATKRIPGNLCWSNGFTIH